MYVLYAIFHSRGFSRIWWDPEPREFNHGISECCWMVPGTVDPSED